MVKASLSRPDKSKIRYVVDEYIDIQDGCYGVFEDHKGEIEFVPKGSAVYVESISNEIETGRKTLNIYFYDSAGQKIEIPFSRRDLTETGILSLMEYGAQVSKQTAKILITSIQNQEPDAKQYYHHNRLGFTSYDGRKVFLGGTAIGVDSTYDGGLKVIPKGSYDEWHSLIEREVLGNIPLELMLAVGVSGVVADYIKDEVQVENILVHCVGESSTGKTSAALIAVSCGASPSFQGDSLVYSFADTTNALMASIQSSYACLIDEGSLCKRNPTDFLYSLAMGKEKNRMSKELNVAASSYFKTAIIMTSEKSILNLCDENTGLKVRNLEFEGITWTKDAASADRIKKTIQTNYGFLVPLAAQSLLDHGSMIVDRYWGWCERIISDAREDGSYNALTERASKQNALIMLGAELVREILDLPLDIEGILAMLREHSLVRDPASVDIGMRAYEYLMQYLDRFYTHFISEDQVEVFGECRGRIKRNKRYTYTDGRISSHVLLVSDSVFEQILREAGFMDKKVVLKRLRALGLLDSEKDRYISDIVIQEGVHVKGYKIRLIDRDGGGSQKEEIPVHPKKQSGPKRVEHVRVEDGIEYDDDDDIIFDDDGEEDSD